MKECLCGCGEQPKPGRKFLPGHDWKLGAALERAVGGIENLKALVERETGRPVSSRD